VPERITRKSIRPQRSHAHADAAIRRFRVTSVVLMYTIALPVSSVWGYGQYVRQEAPFPAIYDTSTDRPGTEPIRYEVLRGDFHMHTTYSDGSLTPADRVVEAWRYGYDVIAITDHGTFAACEEARTVAEALGILLVRGMETGISGNEHYVALDFSADYEPRNPHNWSETAGQTQVFYRDQLRRLDEAGAFVLYAHPHVGLREPTLWGIDQAIIRGLEVKNDVVGLDWNTVESHGTWWYPFAFDWGGDHGLTLFANSDVHDARPDGEHAVTLVLVKDRSVAGVMEALRAGRTLASFNNMLCAHEWVMDLLMSNMVKVGVTEAEDGTMFLRLDNAGPKKLTAEFEGIPIGGVTLGAYQSMLVGLRRVPSAATISWKNLYTRPTANFASTHILTGMPAVGL